jgi:two-component system, response regulator YesN
MKLKIIVFEVGIKNLISLKNTLNFEFADVIFVTTLLEIYDMIRSVKVNIIILSDFKDSEHTFGYIKMLKIADVSLKLIVLSSKDKVYKMDQADYIREGAYFYCSTYDFELIKQKLKSIYQFFLDDESLNSGWSECTYLVINFLKINYPSLKENVIYEISVNTGFSESSICHSVKKDTGKTVIDWLQEVRVKGAKKLLTSPSNFFVKEVGINVGYKSPQGFIKTFKKYTGLSPTEFKNKNIEL